MGVEPTRDRLTAPPGFEVRSPHRERDSSVIGSHSKDHEVNAAGTGQHIKHQARMARDVAIADSARPVAKPKVDRHAARFLLWQPISIDAGQSLHKRGLAAIDVPGGAA